jgi:FlaA1/EpsC-like NDP-sugar epimerase
MPSTIAERWGTLRALRYAGILAFDTTATVCGLYGALALRLSGEVPAIFATEARAAAPLLVLIRLATVLAARLHRWSFRMSGHLEAARLGATMFAGSLVFALGCRSLPGSVYVLEFFLTTSLMAALRYGPRLLGGWHAEWLRRGSAGTLRTVIVGAGSTGDLLARDLLRSQDSKYLKVSTVLLAIPALPPERIRGILDICSASKASFKIIPASYAYLDKRISAAMLQDLSPDDLLARKPVAFDHEEIQGLVQGRRPW